MNFDSPPKHVFIGIPVLLIGGTEIQILNLLKVLKSAGYQVAVGCYYEHDLAMVLQDETGWC